MDPQYPLRGRTVSVDYGADGKYLVTFGTDGSLTFRGHMTGVGDGQDSKAPADGTAQYRTCKVSPDVFVVHWFEPAFNTLVFQVQNLSTWRVATFMVNLGNGEFRTLTGALEVQRDSLGVRVKVLGLARHINLNPSGGNGAGNGGNGGNATQQ